MIIGLDNEYNMLINGTKINEKITQDELCDYRLLDREDLINDLIDWISEATTDKDNMKYDLKYLMSLPDDYVFSSISTNEYIAKSDNEERFNEICEEILKLNEGLNK
jgi:hypothetical protein